MKHEVATSTSINPAYHPQPVSPLQQQRPLVGDGVRLRRVWIEGDKFLSMLAETPLHRLRRSFPMNGEAAAAAVGTRRFPVYGEAGREAD